MIRNHVVALLLSLLAYGIAHVAAQQQLCGPALTANGTEQGPCQTLNLCCALVRVSLYALSTGQIEWCVRHDMWCRLSVAL